MYKYLQSQTQTKNVHQILQEKMNIYMVRMYLSKLNGRKIGHNWKRTKAHTISGVTEKIAQTSIFGGIKHHRM